MKEEAVLSTTEGTEDTEKLRVEKEENSHWGYRLVKGRYQIGDGGNGG